MVVQKSESMSRFLNNRYTKLFHLWGGGVEGLFIVVRIRRTKQVFLFFPKFCNCWQAVNNIPTHPKQIDSCALAYLYK